MKIRPILLAATLLPFLGTGCTSAQEDPSCIPLNEALSVCRNVDDLAVSFIDATPTSAMGSVRSPRFTDVQMVWAAYWEPDVALDTFAQDLAAEYGASLGPAVALDISGMPARRYDFPPGASQPSPVSVLLLDTGGGVGVLTAFARAPDLPTKRAHDAMQDAARVFRTSRRSLTAPRLDPGQGLRPRLPGGRRPA